jgi:hypothetical protein
MNNDIIKTLAVLLAIASPIIAAGIVLERVDRAKDDILRNQDSDGKQWQLINQLRVQVGKLQVSSQCR